MTRLTEEKAPDAANPRYVTSAKDFLGRDFSPDCAQIVCGDAFDVLPHLPSDSVDLIHTSPPYNIEKPYASRVSDNAPISEYLEFLSSVIAEMKRVVRPGGSIFWQTGYTQDDDSGPEIVPIDHLSHDLFRTNPHQFMLWDRIIWRYWGGHAFTKKFTNKHETIMWYVKPGSEPQFYVDDVRERAKSYDKRNNFWGRNPGNVWEVDRVAYGSTGQTSHIAVFPEEVTERIVRACSSPGDLVLDPFAGSGTVPRVARSLSRRWLGIEISPTYAEESSLRIGRQQPCEADALASELLLGLALSSGGRSIPLEDATNLLVAWLNQIDRKASRTEFEDDVAFVFANKNGRTREKADIWKKYDDHLGTQKLAVRDPIAVADSLLCRRYKLRHHFNGVRRFRTALDAMDEIVNSLLRESDLSYVLRILDQEPTTYALTGDLVSASFARARAENNVDTPTSHQGRLL